MPSIAPEGDPNFPPNLDIAPSASAASRVLHAHLPSSAADAAEEKDRESDDAVQDIGRFGIAGRTWEAAYLLRDYCRPSREGEATSKFDPPCPLFPIEQRKRRRTRTIVEVGSGTGFLSLAIAPYLATDPSSPTTLVMTDLDNVCPLLEENLTRAEKRWSSSDSSDRTQSQPPRVLVRPLPWGDGPCFHRMTGQDGLHPDVILASDLIYFEFLYAPLLRTLIALTEPVATAAESPVVLFSYKIRSLTREEPFWRAFGRWFAFEPVQVGRRLPANNLPPGDAATAASPPLTAATDEMVWSRYGAAVAESTDRVRSDGDDDELYIFVCSRHPSTVGVLWNERGTSDESLAGTTLFGHVSDDELLHGIGIAKGYEAGASRFEEILLADVQWD